MSCSCGKLRDAICPAKRCGARRHCDAPRNSAPQLDDYQGTRESGIVFSTRASCQDLNSPRLRDAYRPGVSLRGRRAPFRRLSARAQGSIRAKHRRVYNATQNEDRNYEVSSDIGFFISRVTAKGKRSEINRVEKFASPSRHNESLAILFRDYLSVELLSNRTGLVRGLVARLDTERRQEALRSSGLNPTTNDDDAREASVSPVDCGNRRPWLEW